ncbi:MAG: hypothetical protein AAF899_06775 [Pseudomonadota bacterium]
MSAVWDRVSVAFQDALRETDGGVRRAIARVVSARAARWQRAAIADPRLARDVLQLGQLLELSPRHDVASGLDPEVLAYDAGRADLARELLALMHVTNFEVNELMQEESDAH